MLRLFHDCCQGVIVGVGAGAEDAAPGVLRMRIASRGKLKLPPASSITLIWQRYVPGFNCASETSNWKETAVRSGLLMALASTSGVSKTFTPPSINSMLVRTRTPLKEGRRSSLGPGAEETVSTFYAFWCVGS